MIMQTGLSSSEGNDRQDGGKKEFTDQVNQHPSSKEVGKGQTTKMVKAVIVPGSLQEPFILPGSPVHEERHFYHREHHGEETASLIQHEAALLMGDQVPHEYEYAGPKEGLEFSDKISIAEEDEEHFLVSFTRLIFICIAQIGSSAISVTYLSILLPMQIMEEVGNDQKGTTLGGLTAAGGFISIIGPPIVGYFSDRHNGSFGRRKPYMLAGMIVTVTALFVAGFTTTSGGLAAMICCYIAITIGGVLHCTAFNATIPEFPSQQIGTVSGLVGGLTIIGFAVGAGLGGAASKIGNDGTYYALAGVVLFTWMITLITYRDTMVVHPDHEDEVIAKMGLVQRFIFDLKGMISPLYDFDFRMVFFSRLLMQCGVATVQQFLLFWVSDVLPVANLSVSTRTSILFTPLLLGALISSLLTGKVSDEMGGKRKLFLITSSMVMGICCICVGFVESFYVALAFMLVFGVAMGLFLALDMALACDVLPDPLNVARDLGVWHISLVLPQLVAAPIAGALLDYLQQVGKDTGHTNLGYKVIFSITGLYFIIGGILFVFLRKVK